MTFVSRRWMAYWQDAALGGAAGVLFEALGILLLARATNDYWLPVFATAVPLGLAGGVALSLVAMYWRSVRVRPVGWGPVALALLGALVAFIALLYAMPAWHTLVFHHRFVFTSGYVMTWSDTVQYYSTTWGSALPLWWLALAAVAVALVAVAVARAWGLGRRHTGIKEA